MNTTTGSEDAFAQFAAVGKVEVKDTTVPAAPEPEIKEKPAAPEGAEKEPKADETGGNAGDTGGADQADDGLDEDGELRQDATPEQHEGHLKRLKRERFEARKKARDLEEKLRNIEVENLKSRLGQYEGKDLPPANFPVTVPDIGPEPDPLDQSKYPAGFLDPQYNKDAIAYGVKSTLANERAADLQRQQENQLRQTDQAKAQRIQTQINDLSAKGNDIFDDFQDVVVGPGLKGEWKMQQATFEAAHEAEHGARILRDLATNPAEAERVSNLSNPQQYEYVREKNAEYAEKIKPRKIPNAGAPPTTTARGGNSKTAISPATDNLDDFEKLVRQDTEKSRR